MADITPFSIAVSDAELADLKQRLTQTRWPEPETVDDWSQGIPLSYTKELADYWANEYDWRAREAHLNSFDQFTTEIDGIDVHFVHVRSPHEDAMPLVITHGWPGSIVEFHKIIGPLTDPTAHGGDAADAFHVVCPSLPGFGFSGKPDTTGTTTEKIGDMWATLMSRLGYDKYGAQGGDWGSAVTTAIGANDADHCVGIHTNMPIGRPEPDQLENLDDVELAAIAARKEYEDWDSGYSKQQSTRPQTLGYGLADSPSGQMAWIVEKFWKWTDNNGHPEDALTRDELLDNVMLYWIPNNGASSGRIYWESFAKFGAGTVDIPTGCSIFPNEIIVTSRRWAANRYKNITHWNVLDRGGHFPAFEVPDLYVDEIRTFFRTVR